MKKLEEDEVKAEVWAGSLDGEDNIKSSAELVDQNECLNFSIKGEKKMSLEMDRDVEKTVYDLFTKQMRQILQAMDVDIIFDDGEGAFAILDDVCRVNVDRDMPNGVDITFASNTKPWAVAEFAMKFVKMTDLLNIPVFVWEDHEMGSIFNGYDVYSGRYLEDVE